MGFIFNILVHIPLITLYGNSDVNLQTEICLLSLLNKRFLLSNMLLHMSHLFDYKSTLLGLLMFVNVK